MANFSGNIRETTAQEEFILIRVLKALIFTVLLTHYVKSPVGTNNANAAICNIWLFRSC